LTAKTQGLKGLTLSHKMTRNCHELASNYLQFYREAKMGFSVRPPLTTLKRRLDAQREKATRLNSDGFVRETFRMPREAARLKARQMLEQYPKAAYWTEIESWSEYPGDEIEFTMRWLESAD
jgi:hypothetical protein